MNRIFILGNGFDLAHGKKTCYADFIKWYQIEAVKNYQQTGEVHDKFISVSKNFQGINYAVSTFDQLKKEKGFKYKNYLFGELSEEFESKTWVNIEGYYFKKLSIIASNYKLTQEEDSLREVRHLNEQFVQIQNLLHKYLETIPNHSVVIPEMMKLFEKVSSDDKTLFLSFNYTNTIEHYIEGLESIHKGKFSHVSNPIGETKLIHIHGQLGDMTNPIIFGYGDQHDETYAKLENFNNSEYLKYIKYHHYTRTSGFASLNSFINRFLNGNPYFDVNIIGHSCGLSDRTLLKYIFEHKYCQRIYIHHYRDIDDFLEKSSEITRHFKDKTLFLDRVAPFSEARKCPKLEVHDCG